MLVEPSDSEGLLAPVASPLPPNMSEAQRCKPSRSPCRSAVALGKPGCNSNRNACSIRTHGVTRPANVALSAPTWSPQPKRWSGPVAATGAALPLAAQLDPRSVGDLATLPVGAARPPGAAEQADNMPGPPCADMPSIPCVSPLLPNPCTRTWKCRFHDRPSRGSTEPEAQGMQHMGKPGRQGWGRPPSQVCGAQGGLANARLETAPPGVLAYSTVCLRLHVSSKQSACEMQGSCWVGNECLNGAEPPSGETPTSHGSRR